ncbi:unannotated protein [freshwater metagenome]|uniref:Unannotated protein n=1 Tax=freshwater metagenome TaxID=449393 RepID=A0A6J7J9W8_9ZZZZ|nr:YraN family protein [Actinomycetota bacterium]
MTTDPRIAIGRAGEQFALEHLERLGFALVARNHRTRHGEIDLVVCDARTLVFAEVKTRVCGRGGPTPWDALHERKRRQVRRMAAAFLHDVWARPHAQEIRFDAIGVLVDDRGDLAALEHLEAAF